MRTRRWWASSYGAAMVFILSAVGVTAATRASSVAAPVGIGGTALALYLVATMIGTRVRVAVGADGIAVRDVRWPGRPIDAFVPYSELQRLYAMGHRLRALTSRGSYTWYATPRALRALHVAAEDAFRAGSGEDGPIARHHLAARAQGYRANARTRQDDWDTLADDFAPTTARVEAAVRLGRASTEAERAIVEALGRRTANPDLSSAVAGMI